MDRAEAGAVFDAGLEACVRFVLELTAGYEAQIARLEEQIARLEEQIARLKQRTKRLEEQTREDSRTSSKPLSS